MQTQQFFSYIMVLYKLKNSKNNIKEKKRFNWLRTGILNNILYSMYYFLYWNKNITIAPWKFEV
jgi:hypothetical protein